MPRRPAGIDIITALQDGVEIDITVEDTTTTKDETKFHILGNVEPEDLLAIRVGDIGLPCTVEDDRGAQTLIQGPGSLAFVGMDGNGEEVCGVVFNDDVKGHNGTSDGNTYFVCDNGHGALVPPSKVKLIKPAKPVPAMSTELIQASWIGFECEVEGHGPGKLAWVGMHAETKEPFAGVVLDEPNGEHDGTVGEFHYFKSPPNHGVLVVVELVTVDVPEAQRNLAPIEFRASTMSNMKGRRGSTLGSISWQAEVVASVHAYDKEYSDNEDDEGGYSLYKAIADYTADKPGDLAFVTGDIIRVTDEGDGPASWLYGVREEDDKEGSFPGTYVKKFTMGAPGGSSGGQMFSLGGTRPLYRSFVFVLGVVARCVGRAGRGPGLVFAPRLAVCLRDSRVPQAAHFPCTGCVPATARPYGRPRWPCAKPPVHVFS